MTNRTRRSLRKKTQPIAIDRISLTDTQTTLCRKAQLIEISEHGCKIQFERKSISTPHRDQLLWNQLLGRGILIHIEPMDLLLHGVIVRIAYQKKGIFILGVDYSETDSAFWRACFFELLPSSSSF